MNCTLAKPNAGPTRQFVNTSAFRAPYGASGNGIPNSLDGRKSANGTKGIFAAADAMSAF